MTTRSAIGRVTETGAHEAVYVWKCGWPQEIGKVLLNSYNTSDKVDKLFTYLSQKNRALELLSDTPENSILMPQQYMDEHKGPLVYPDIVGMTSKHADLMYLYLWDDPVWLVYTEQSDDEGYEWDVEGRLPLP